MGLWAFCLHMSETLALPVFFLLMFNTTLGDKFIVRIKILFICCFLLLSIGAVLTVNGQKQATYSMKDLETLVKQSAWEEILQHLSDIAPSKRTEKWQEIGEQAATEYTALRAKDADLYFSMTLAKELPKRYAFLKTSKKFLAKRNEVVLAASTQCFDNSYSGEECFKDLLEIVNSTPDDHEFAFKVGKVVVRKQFVYVAVPFFYQAVKGGSKDFCEDEDFQRSIIGGLGLPNDDDRAKKSTELVSSVCWDKIKGNLLKTLSNESPNSYLTTNACALLKAKGEVLSPEIKQICNH